MEAINNRFVKLCCCFLLTSIQVDASFAAEGVIGGAETLTNVTYTVESGDDIGTLVYSMGLNPAWGHEGFVQKVIELNKTVVQNNGELIFPSDELILPVSPFFACNVRFNGRKVELINKVKTREQYRKLLDGFDATCRQVHKSRRHAYFSKASSRNVATKNDTEIKQAELEEESQVQNFKNFGRIKVEPRSSFTKVTATEVSDSSKATILSDRNYGVRMTWEQVWSPSFVTQIFADVEQQVYQENPGRRYVKDGNSVTLSNVGVGSSYKVFGNFRLNSEVVYGNEVYVFAPNLDLINLDKGNALKGRVGIGLDFAESSFKLGGELGGLGILGTDVAAGNYRSENGVGYYVLAGMSQRYKRMTFLGEISWEQLNKDSKHFRQKHSTLNFSLGVAIDFGA